MIDVVPDVAPAEGAAVPAPSAPNIVHLANGHTVTLHRAVTIPIGMAALSVIKQGGTQAVIEAGLAQVYLDFGIESWDFPEPVTPETIAANLPFADGGLDVAEAADALYSNEVMRPLLLRLSRLSPTGPTGGSTSAIPRSGSKRPMRSGRSSRNGTAGLVSKR